MPETPLSIPAQSSGCNHVVSPWYKRQHQFFVNVKVYNIWGERFSVAGPDLGMGLVGAIASLHQKSPQSNALAHLYVVID